MEKTVMKYLHRFNSQQEFEQAYNDHGKYDIGVAAVVAGGVTYYYDPEMSDDRAHYFVNEDKSATVYTEYRNPVVGNTVILNGSSTWLEITDVIYQDAVEGYQEPWVSYVEGQSGVTYNKKMEGIDLALPSGLIWAERNIGAAFPEQSGYYFAWGETTPKEVYDWNTYSFGVEDNIGKYNARDGKIVLDISDDAAAAIIGDGWRMPTVEEYNELQDYRFCSCDAAVVNDVPGTKLTSKSNGNSIFFPQWGSMIDDELMFVSYFGRYWSATLADTTHPYMWGWCHPTSPNIMVHDSSITRQIGCVIRAVKEPENYVPYNGNK